MLLAGSNFPLPVASPPAYFPHSPSRSRMANSSESRIRGILGLSVCYPQRPFLMGENGESASPPEKEAQDRTNNSKRRRRLAFASRLTPPYFPENENDRLAHSKIRLCGAQYISCITMVHSSTNSRTFRTYLHGLLMPRVLEKQKQWHGQILAQSKYIR